MIPLYLSITGFLSYRETAEIDFTLFDLACISGSNGAGKSSLLDAITWVLFGQARKRDDSVINAQSTSAEVCLVFAYEHNIFRVQRTKPRDKASILEFAILHSHDLLDASTPPITPDGRLVLTGPELVQRARWKPLTERSLRETESRIESTLRMDYETFVNAAFFLQGKADQFTQQRSGDRKRILGSILGLEIWEAYRQRAGERRKSYENEISLLEGQLQMIDADLSEEEARRERLKELKEDLERLTSARSLQEAALVNVRKIADTLAEQGKLVEALARQVQAARLRLESTQERLDHRRRERQGHDAMLHRAGEIESAYNAWQQARRDLENWEEVAGRFREYEKRREEPRSEISAAHARLTQEQEHLRQNSQAIEKAQSERTSLDSQLSQAQAALAAVEAEVSRRGELESSLEAQRLAQSEAKTENALLMKEMKDLRERIDGLKKADGAECPLCGQPMAPAERAALVAELEGQGKELGDRYRTNQTRMRELEQQARELEQQVSAFAQAGEDRLRHAQQVTQLSGRLEALESQAQEWQSGGALRLAAVEAELEAETYAPEARQRLKEIDAELKAIGYDAAAHDAVRRQEAQGRSAEGELRALESARAALAPLDREIADSETQLASLRADLDRQEAEHTQAAAALAAAQAQAPDLELAEKSLMEVREQEYRRRDEVVAINQIVLHLEKQKKRRLKLEGDRGKLAEEVSKFRQLERAFSKDGVPALLIEQALPQIEGKANEILERLSGGNMSVRFVTQAAYKDKRRDDLKETLDILISDGAGARDYEMFSGGEAFRVNFAIRLALSEVLAQRAGARLQTLVIDEGFGSQDTLGRQRLVEAINLVRADFAKILVITHIDELKDAFPNRIEVEKTERGSQVLVI
jgi:DNA repair protein SbcC/Rad50